MATIFERVKSALDLLVPRAAKLVSGSVDALIARHCRDLRLAYSGRLLQQGREPVDYSRPTTQLAYLYRTVPSHADWVRQALATIPHTMEQLLKTGSVKIACVGGGPGTDMLGLAKYAEEVGFGQTSLSFVILDRERGWNTPRRVLASVIGPHIAETFQHLDLTDRDNWVDAWTFADADLFTFSFSLSEVWCYNASGAVTEFLRQLVRKAKRGAIFAYVDNGGDNFTAVIETEFGTSQRIELVGSKDNEKMRMSFSEQRDTLENSYMTRFGGERVKMGGNVSIRVWQKQ